MAVCGAAYDNRGYRRLAQRDEPIKAQAQSIAFSLFPQGSLLDIGRHRTLGAVLFGVHSMTHGTAAFPQPPSPGGHKTSRHWAIFPHAFTAAECTTLQDLFAQHEGHDGGLVAGRFDSKIRRSSLVWLPDEPNTQWVNTRIARLVSDANHDVFHYALDGLDEQVQLAGYGPDHYYDWHVDRGQGATAGRRKLTLSVQLTDPSQYIGGDLELNATGRVAEMPRAQGTAVVFAAHTIHRVSPIVSGMRHSLVTWVHGPDFV